MNFDLLLISGVSVSTLIFFLLFMLKKQLWLAVSDKNTETCSDIKLNVSKENKLENKLVTIDLTNTETITKFDEDIKIQKSCFTFRNIF